MAKRGTICPHAAARCTQCAGSTVKHSRRLGELGGDHDVQVLDKLDAVVAEQAALVAALEMSERQRRQDRELFLQLQEELAILLQVG